MAAGCADAIPGGATVAITAIIASTWKMYYDINKCLGISFSENFLKSVASGVVSNIASNGVGVAAHAGANLLSCIPVVGNIAALAGGVAANRASIYTAAVSYLKILEKVAKSGETLNEDSFKQYQLLEETQLVNCFEHEEEDVDEHEGFYQCYSAFINDEYDDIDVFLEQLDILILECPNEYSNLSLLGAVACLDKILKIYKAHWAERDNCDIDDFRKEFSEYICSGIEYINNVKCSCSNSKSNEIKKVDYCLNAHFNKAIQRDDENDEIVDCSEDISGNLFPDEYIKALYEQTVRYINSFWLKDEEFDEATEKMDVLKNEDEDKSLTDGEHEYLSEYKEIIAEGKISERDYRFLLKIKHSNGISDERAKELENFAAQSSLSKNEQEYLDEYKDIIQSGTMTERDKRYLNKIKVSNGISDSRAIELEKMIKSK